MDNTTAITGGSGSDTVVLDMSAVGAQPAYDFSSDTITLDPSIYSSSITIPNGGYSLTSTGSTIDWASAYATYGDVNITSDGISMKEGADIKIGNRSLTAVIDKLEERLGILHPNPELEDRWEELKNLRKQYQELEKELLEKEKMWKILKEK